MGIFLKSSLQVVESNSTGNDGEEVIEQNYAEVVEEEQNVKPMWGRLIFAILVLTAIFFAGIFTAKDKDLVEWSKILLHSFELLLGAFIGILTGEVASKKN